jgi:hypothetical protein
MDIKDTLPPFYENPKSWSGPQDTGKTLISKIQNNQESFNRLQSKLQLFQTYPSPTCKDKQCNPLRSVMENPWSMTQEPSIFCRYGLGADVWGTDPLGAFELHLTPNPSQVTPSSTSTPTLPPRLYNNQTQVTIVEVKDLRHCGYWQQVQRHKHLDEMDKILCHHIK